MEWQLFSDIRQQAIENSNLWEEESLEGIYQKSILGQNRKEQGPEDARVPGEEWEWGDQ